MGSYTLFWNQGQPAGGVKVSITVPAGWTDRTDPTGSPKFTVPGLGGAGGPSIHLIPCNQATGAACLEAVIQRQLADDLPTASREAQPDGRVWVTLKRGTMTEARLYFPASNGGVVSYVVMLTAKDAGKLAELKAVGNTLRVG